MQPRLKFLDRYLTLWIFLAMGAGIGLGLIFPESGTMINQWNWGTTNLPLAIGLILMMYPPLARVDFRLLPQALKDKKAMGISLLLNWVIGPILMFVLAVLFLRDEPAYMMGLILIGLARCIAMVIVWNDLAKGNREYAALLIALNAVFQVLSYSFYVWLFIQVLPQALGIAVFEVEVSMFEVGRSVLIYLGIPFLLGFLSFTLGVYFKGEEWYKRHFIPAIAPITLYALLLTIVFMFSLKADQLVQLPWDVLRISAPLLIYFVLMFLVSFWVGKKARLPYDQNASIAFTATGNNFELAIAVAIGVFGIHSPQALVGVIGPLIEVPVLILLVRVSLWFKKRYDVIPS
jgi:ACR3 family arsenite transporter